MEGVSSEEQKTGSKTEAKKPETNFLRDKLPVIGYGAASLGHLLAGIGGISKAFPKPLAEFFDKYALKFSKLVNVANYTHKGVEALANKRGLEGLARLAYSAIVPFVPLELVFTASGISSGPTMFEQAIRHKIKYKNATIESPQGSPESISEDLKENWKAFCLMFKETFGNLWGADRKVFIHPDREQGHTMFLSAWGNFLGAIGGILAGSDRNSALGVASSLARNGGSFGCDWAKFIHPDLNNKLSAAFYAVVSACDLSKLFTSKATAHTLSQFGMAMNNFANYFYVNTSKATTDGEFKDYKAANDDVFLQKAA